MKKPFIAILLAGFMVNMAEGPWAWAQTPPPPAPDAQAPAAAQQPLQAPPAGAQPNTPGATAPTPPPANPPAAPSPSQTPPTPTQAPAPGEGRRPGDLIRPSLRRTTGRTTRPPAAARPVSPATPGGAPAPAAPRGTGSAPSFQAPSPTTGGGTTGSGPTPGSSPSTPNVNLPGANAEGVMELPGEKEFNQCKKVPPNKRILKFSFKPETEITDLIGWISAISCTQFLIGGTPVAGKKVTVISPQLITLEEAYRLFLGALESVQLTVEPMGKFLRIVDTSRARFSNLPFQKDGSSGSPEGGIGDKRYVTRLFRFDHLDPNEVMNLYNQVRGEQGVAVAFQGSLIITDQSVMLDRFGEIVHELDQPSVIKEKIWMVRVRNTSATEMASRLAEIFAVQQMGMGGRRPGAPGAPMPPPAPAAPGARATQTVKRVDLASQLSITKLIPDERSNQLIVVANEQAYEWLLTIMKKLDVPIEGGGDGRFHIYYCEHANCDELAATLSAVTGVSVIGGVGSRRTARTSVPGQAPPPTPVPSAPGQQTGAPLFEGDVRVTFDAATNSLVVYSSLKDYQSLRRVIEKLDGPRKQVYVEAMILEVLLDKSRDIGIAYHGGIPTKIGGEESVVLGGFDAGKTLNPAGLAGDLVGLAGAVFGPALSATTSRLFGTQVDIPSFGAFIKLLQKNNDVNVLSTPHLLITNNQEGEISVGQRLPFPSGFLGGFGGGAGGLPGQAGGLGGLLGGTAVNREDVSLRMKLIPSVNEYNMIRLDVDVEISDLASPNFNGLGPATTKRTAKTPVVCKDQQTVIIGGLMSDRQSDTVSKIPVLGDIPVLGFFFRNTSKQMVKSNIIIALTPYVINDMEDLRRVAEKKMRERREFIERYSAVEDKAHFDAAIDYRRKRGMLEEINRASREIDDEEAALRVIRERELQDESTPIEPPGQGRPRAGQPPGTGQVTPPPAAPAPAPRTEPDPTRPETEKREVGQAPAPAPETPALPLQPATRPVAVKREP